MSATTGGTGVLSNDSDPVEGTAVSVVRCDADASPLTCTTALGGTVTIQTNGHFTYTPQAGDTGTDTFTYVIQDAEGGEDTGTVSILLSKTVWYVKNDVGAVNTGAGTSTDPFSTLSDGSANAVANDAEDASGASHYIYVRLGDGTSLHQAAGITLKDGQKLLGEAVSLIVDPDDGGREAADHAVHRARLEPADHRRDRHERRQRDARRGAAARTSRSVGCRCPVRARRSMRSISPRRSPTR